MYKDKRIIAFIPARGGSKGIKNKNITNLAGKPLITYSIEAAKQSSFIDEIFVSTDSDAIAEVARSNGADVPFMRPDELAGDHSEIIDAILYAISELKVRGEVYDTLVLLQPTQPLRTGEDIDGAIEEFFSRGEEGLVSVSLVEDHPLLIRRIGEDGYLDKLLPVNSSVRRQDMPPYYRVNGCIYINSIDELTEQTSFNDNPVPFIMDTEHAVDIDESKDLWLAEYYLK